MTPPSVDRPTLWRPVLFLTVVAAINYSDRAALAAVLPLLRSDFQASDFALGLMSSVFLWAYAIGSPIAGLVADRFPRRRVVIASLVAWSLVTVLTGCAVGPWSIVGLRLCLGFAECLYVPCAVALIADYHGPRTRGRALSVHALGLSVGVVVGSWVAGRLGEHFGWRAGFLFFGFLGLATALLARRNLPAVAQLQGGRLDRPGILETLRYLRHVRTYYIILLKAVVTGVSGWLFLSWLPLYFRESFGMTLSSAAFAGTFMLQIAQMIGIALGGWLSDRVAARLPSARILVLSTCYMIAGPFLLLFLADPGFTSVVIAISAFSLFRGLGAASEEPILCDIVPARYRATAMGIMNMTATSAGGLAVLLAGMFRATLGWNAIFAASSVGFLAAGLALLVAALRFIREDMAQAGRYAAEHGRLIQDDGNPAPLHSAIAK